MGFTHFNEEGRAKMVDTAHKDETLRIATAYGEISICDKVYESIINSTNKKGDVLAVAQVAGIMAAKKTHELIPMCHNIFLNGVDINFTLKKNLITCTSRVKTKGVTGVEMEALTAVNIALLTVYDMCKAIDKSMEINNVYLLEKEGGKSGHFTRK
ncbi:MAG: cyclic pyranopterin monophosphate synthase MoaC [Lachnospirales bacterium]